MDAIRYSNNETFKPENFHTLEQGGSGKSQVAKCIRDNVGGSLHLVDNNEYRQFATERDAMDDGSSHSELLNSEVILDKRSSSLERDILDFDTLLENENLSPIQEASPTDNSQPAGSPLDKRGDSRSSEQEYSQDIEQSLASSEESEETTSDEDSGGDSGGDYTVSKYYESKISRQEETRFGYWSIKSTVNDRIEDTEPVGEIIVDQCVSKLPVGIADVAGTSHSGIPPLKLTLKKSSPGREPETSKQIRKGKQPKKEKLPKIKLSPKMKHSHKPKKRGRPLGSKHTKLTTRQRLLNIFKKGKGKKRGPRTEPVSCSMPPTIRSIAKL